MTTMATKTPMAIILALYSLGREVKFKNIPAIVLLNIQYLISLFINVLTSESTKTQFVDNMQQPALFS